MYTPNGKIYLVQTLLSSDNEHQIRFNDSTDQYNYFVNCTRKEVTENYNYIRHENVLHVPITYDEAIQYNYLMFQNYFFSDKWFYCFIEKVDYENNSSVKLHLKVDVWQTWQYELSFEKSFVEREHVGLDYANTLSDLPEEGVLVERMNLDVNFQGGYFVFCSADVTKADTTTSTAQSFKLGAYTIPAMVLFWGSDQVDSFSMTMQNIANKGYGDRVLGAIYVPVCGDLASLVVNPIDSADLGGSVPVCTGTNYPDEVLKQSINFDLSTINLGFKKALTYPYAKVVVQDMTTGQTIELAPEKFDSLNIEFEIQSTISETPSYRIIPLNYKGLDKSFSDSMVVKCNTSLPVANNSYAKYLMNNQDFNRLNMIGSGLGIGASIMSGSAMGAYSGFEGIANTLLQENQAKKLPNQVSAISDGALERINFQNGIKITLMTMDDDHLQMAQDFWNMYGYPKKCLDYPTFGTRDHYFIKLQDANINGNIPQEDLNEIQFLFNRGITFWSNPDTFRQY